MTQRTPTDGDGTAEVYDVPHGSHTTRPVATAPAVRPSPTSADVDVVTPVDRVRWGPVIAGLFAALATLAFLAVAKKVAAALKTADRPAPKIIFE